MSLQKQTISLNLSNGIDQKSDDKVGPNDSFSDARDVTFDKIGTLYKRPGNDQLGVNSYYPLSNPLTIGASPIPNNVMGYKDQKLLINKGALYSQYANDLKWYFKGHHYPITIDKSIIHSNQYSSYNADSQTLNGITAYAYREDNPSDVTKNAVCLTVIEEQTGNYILNSVALEYGALIENVKVVKFSSAMFAIWRSGNTLKIANIPTNSTTAINTTSLFTDMKFIAPYTGEILSAEVGFDIVYTNKSGVGERVFVTYYNSSNQIKVFSLLSTGVVDTTMGSLLISNTLLNRGISIYYNTTADVLLLGYSELSLSTYTTQIQLASFSTTAITAGSVFAAGASSMFPVTNITFVRDPFTPANTQVFFDEYFSGQFAGKTVDQPTIYRREIAPTGAVGSTKILVMNGVGIAAKAIADDSRKTIYLPTMANTFTQGTHFILDVFRGRSDSQPNVLAKFNYGIAATKRSYYLPHFPQLSSGKYYFPVMVNVAIADSFQGLYRTGISKAIIDLTPKYSASNVLLNNAVYMSGGYVGYYDGADTYEHGFFLNPEAVQVSVLAQNSAAISVQIIAQGSATVKERTLFTFTSGGMMSAIGSCVGPSNYLTFNTPTTSYVVWFKIAGTGSAPAAAGTKIEVDLEGTETPDQVLKKFKAAIIASGAAVTVLDDGSIMNNAVGVVTDATVVGMVNGLIGLKNAGSVQYSAIFYYVDNNGQVIRSAPSIPTTATIVANSFSTITVWAPPITNKNISMVMVQLYGTTSNGTTLKKLTQFISTDKAMAQTSQAIVFTDNDADSSINTGEAIYTSGGVLSNYSPGATRHLSIFKNRLIATDEDLNSIIYSKTSVQGNAFEFSEELTVDIPDDSDPLRGHAQLDDKMIIGKGQKIYYLAGDGANDLGQGSSFTIPTLISADVGISNHNSIVQYPLGLIFKSDKGIYLLDRSLQVSYAGKNADNFKSAYISKGVLLKNDNQVRFTVQNSNDVIVYDYLQQKWVIHSNGYATDATMFGDSYARVNTSGVVFVENKTKWTDGVTSYNHSVKTNWLQVKNVQDYQRIYRLIILGQLRSAHSLQFKIYYNYDDTNFDFYSFDSSSITDGVYQPMIHLAKQKCDAIKIEMVVVPNGGTEACLDLVDMSFQVGVKAGLMKVNSSKRI